MITDLNEIESSALNLNKKDKTRLADKLLQIIHGKLILKLSRPGLMKSKREKYHLNRAKLPFMLLRMSLMKQENVFKSDN